MAKFFGCPPGEPWISFLRVASMKNGALIAVLVVLAVAGAVAAWVVLSTKPGVRPSVTVTLRVTVTPQEQAGFVAANANSARFKYEIGTRAGVRPLLSQQLTAKAMPEPGLVEMRVGVQSKAEAQRYADSFVEILQAQCGSAVELKLDKRLIQ